VRRCTSLRPSPAANRSARRRACELQHDYRHRLLQRSVRSSSATADSGRLCLALPQRRSTPADTSQIPAAPHRYPQPRDVTCRSHGAIAVSGRTANRQIPIAALPPRTPSGHAAVSSLEACATPARVASWHPRTPARQGRHRTTLNNGSSGYRVGDSGAF
jgi:hypothetical protein